MENPPEFFISTGLRTNVNTEIKSSFGYKPTGPVIKWDGSNISSVTSIISKDFTFASVDSVSPAPLIKCSKLSNGELLIYGGFVYEGASQNVNFVAKWNGNSLVPFSQVREVVDNSVNGKVVEYYNGEYYYAYSDGIYKSNGSSSWSLISGTDNSVGQFNTANMRIIDNDLYFLISNSSQGFQHNTTPYNNFIKLTSSETVSDPSFNPNGSVTNSEYDSVNNKYIAYGSFSQIGGINSNLIATWNGTSWSSVGVNKSFWTIFNSKSSIERSLFSNSLYYCTLNDTAYISNEQTNAGRLFRINSSSEVTQFYSNSSPFSSEFGNSHIVKDSNNNLYVIGNFTTIEGISANRIARWNGTAWSALGEGLSEFEFSYFAPIVKNRLFVEGNDIYFLYFKIDAGIEVKKWNGTSWSSVFSSNYHLQNWAGSAYISGICKYQNDFYIFGQFTNTNGIETNNIAKWNGTAWSALGTGIRRNSALFSSILSVKADSNGNIFVVGSFNLAGSVTTNGIARWNGTAWSALGSGTSSVNSGINDMQIDSNNNVYVGGSFTTIGGITANRIARWNGTAWSALGEGITNGNVNDILIDGSDIYVSGDFLLSGTNKVTRIAKWNGSSWIKPFTNKVITGNGPLVKISNDFYIISQSNVFFYDSFINESFPIATNSAPNVMASWNGTAWSIFGCSNGGRINDIIEGANGDIFFALSGTTVLNSTGSSTTVNRIARWNGTTWNALGTGLNGNGFGLTKDGSNNIFVCGAFTNAGGTTTNRVAMWNGTAWSALGTGVNSTCTGIKYDTSNNILYAMGGFTTAGSATGVNYVARWNGTAWSGLGTGSLGGSFSSDYAKILIQNSNVYFRTSSTSIDRWNGTTYSRNYLETILTKPINGNYLSLQNYGSDIYFSGTFTQSSYRTSIIKWNGTSLSLGVGNTNQNNNFDNAVRDILKTPDGNVYVCGDFTSIGSTTNVNRIARWNGTAWNALGTGLNTIGYTLGNIGNTVYVVGNFATAGGVTVNGIASWNGTAWSALGGGIPSQQRETTLLVDGNNIYCGPHKWNGTSWSYDIMRLSPVIPGTSTSPIATIEKYESDFYYGGSILGYDPELYTRSPVVHWNGSAWRECGTNPPDSLLGGLVYDSVNNLLYAYGNFTTIDGVSANRIARWNGTAWSALGTGLNNFPVGNMQIDSSGNLYVTGLFTTAGGTTVNRIAMWNGTAWNALGTGLDGTGKDLHFVNNTLYVSGDFTSAGGVANTNRIAKWNGSSWLSVSNSVPTTQFGTSVTSMYVASDNNIMWDAQFAGITQGTDFVVGPLRWNGSSWNLVAPKSNYGYASTSLCYIDENSGGYFYASSTYGTNFDGTLRPSVGLQLNGTEYGLGLGTPNFAWVQSFFTKNNKIYYVHVPIGRQVSIYNYFNTNTNKFEKRTKRLSLFHLIYDSISINSKTFVSGYNFISRSGNSNIEQLDDIDTIFNVNKLYASCPSVSNIIFPITFKDSSLKSRHISTLLSY